MIRTAVVGLWVCAVTVAAGFAGTKWDFMPGAPVEGGKKQVGKLTQVKVRPVNIPVVENGKVTGYIIVQLTFTSPAEALKNLGVKPDIFILDAAFNGIYSGTDLDIKNLNKESWGAMTAKIKESVNARFGSDIVHDIVFEEFSFLPVGELRGKSFKLGGATKEKAAPPPAGQH